MRKITKNICINPVTRYKIFLKKKEPETKQCLVSCSYSSDLPMQGLESED